MALRDRDTVALSTGAWARRNAISRGRARRGRLVPALQRQAAAEVPMLRNKLRHVWLGTVTVAAALAAVGCGASTGSGNGTTDQSGQTAHTLSGAAGTTGAGGAGVPVLGPASTGSAGTGVTTGAAP